MFRNSSKCKESEGVFKGVAMASSVLVMHLLLIIGLGLAVIFLAGIATYMVWIAVGGIGLLSLSGYLFYKKIRREGKTLGETLRAPDFQGRSVEVDLMGGLVTMRLGKADPKKEIGAGDFGQRLLLEDPQTLRLREIQVLADLLEKDLITREEFDRAKSKLFSV
ncbi:MAG: SHOCT domain-containing protein [Desulfosarcinaceae bacterium]